MRSDSQPSRASSGRKIGTLVATLLALAIVVGLSLTACSSGDATVAEGDSGAEEAIAVGGILEVDLESHPSAGYVWLVADVDPEVLVQSGEPSFEPENDEPGTPGVETFYFEGVGPGSTTLVLEYFPPGEFDEPERTFEMAVTVE